VPFFLWFFLWRFFGGFSTFNKGSSNTPLKTFWVLGEVHVHVKNFLLLPKKLREKRPYRFPFALSPLDFFLIAFFGRFSALGAGAKKAPKLFSKTRPENLTQKLQKK
jgi:hypothetical protein